MKFLVVEEQSGEGCGYTIGCGVRTYERDCASVELLLKELEREAGDAESDEKSDGWLGDKYGEGTRSRVAIYTVSGVVEVDVDEWERRFADKEIAESRVCEEKKERAELLRLQKKFASGVR